MSSDFRIIECIKSSYNEGIFNVESEVTGERETFVNNLHKEKYKWAITTYPKVTELCKSNTNGYVIFKKNII